MKATLLFPTGEARELTEDEIFTLYVLCDRFMGLPVLCADINQVLRVLETPKADTLMERSTFAMYAPHERQQEPVNEAATTRLEELTELPLDGPVRGVVLLIEAVPAALAKQLGRNYSLAF